MQETDKKKDKSSPMWLKILAVVLVLFAIACIVVVMLLYRQYHNGMEEITSVREQVVLESDEPKQVTPPSPSVSAAVEPESDEEASVIETPVEIIEEAEPVITCPQVIDFNATHEINPDIYAWLQVPGTDVDHPVLQSNIDNYYILRNLDGSEGYPGCLYTNISCNKKDFSDTITIIYGHNMPTNLMFTSLHNFEDKSVFDENETFTVYTEQNRFTYELIAAVWYNDDYIPYYFDTTTADGMLNFWNSVQTGCDFVNEPSYIRDGTEVFADDKLIVLSTCIRKNGRILQGRRYLVIGKLIETAVCE